MVRNFTLRGTIVGKRQPTRASSDNEDICICPHGNSAIGSAIGVHRADINLTEGRSDRLSGFFQK
jgi:hypothetical protein